MAVKSSMWDHAAKAGLALGGASVLYLALTALKVMVGSNDSENFSFVWTVLLSILGIALWVAKLVGCVYLMKYFMQKFAATDQDMDRSRLFRFGALAALLSALVYSAANLAYTTLIAPDTYEAALDYLRQMPQFSASELAQAEQMMGNMNMPTIGFFSNVIYCFLYGTILSAILSKRICPDNPF